MKKNILVFLLLWGGAELSAQTVLQQFAAVSSGAGTVSDMDLPQPTAPGSVLLAMPVQLSPDIKVESVTDNAPDGGNTYKQVVGATSSCGKKSLEIWYCENCHPGVTELKFHLTGHVTGSINGFMEVAGLALSSVVDGSGVHLSDGAASSAGSEVGPSIRTTANDFVIARYFSAPPLPNAVTPAEWKYSTSFAYVLNGPAGTYQPTLTGGKAANQFCMGIAAFKAAPPAPPTPASPPASQE
jgi:hypothetical protein